MFIKRGSGDVGSVTTQIASFLNEFFSVIFFPEATTTDGKKVKRIHGTLLQSAIDAVASENGYAYIFDYSTGFVLYADASTDVSSLVKSKLGL